ncbi:TPA: DUF1372 family protein [Streptococcus pyogenes]|nr:DUF1372 family protein [Streptococcus pyogenes]
MQSFALSLSIIALALSTFNAGLVVARKHYRPQLVSLQKKIDELEARKPIIIHQVDNAGGQLIGTVTAKERINGHYTVTIGAYGKFLVTKEQYEALAVGDEIPDYLRGVGK